VHPARSLLLPAALGFYLVADVASAMAQTFDSFYAESAWGYADWVLAGVVAVTTSTTVDSIKKSLVALKMARALEVLDATLRRIEQGEIDAIEALAA
jgi:hypothetical protein